MIFDDEGGPRDGLPGAQRAAQENRRLVPVPCGEDRRLRMRRDLCRGLVGEIGAGDRCAAAPRLDLDRLDFDLLLRADEAEPLLVRDLE